MLETRESEESQGVHLGKQAPSHLPPGVPGHPFFGKQTTDFLIGTGATSSVLNMS